MITGFSPRLMSTLSDSLTSADLLVSLPWYGTVSNESAKGGELGRAVSQISSAMAPSIPFGPSLQIPLWKNWIKNKSCVCKYFEGGSVRLVLTAGQMCRWGRQQPGGRQPAAPAIPPGSSATPAALPCPFPAQAGEAGSGELGIFEDNVAPRTNVYRDCFSAAEGRGRTGQARAQTRDF